MKTLFFTALTCQHQQSFRNHPITHGCADPFQNILSAGFIRLLWHHIPPKPWFGPAPLSRLQSVASIPAQYAYMLLRRYYFYQRFLLSSVEKSSEGRLPHRLSGKNQGFAQVRGLQASACLCQRFTLLIWRSIGAEPKLFLWNSLIKSSPVGDTSWRDGGMRFLCFSKV